MRSEITEKRSDLSRSCGRGTSARVRGKYSSETGGKPGGAARLAAGGGGCAILAAGGGFLPQRTRRTRRKALCQDAGKEAGESPARTEGREGKPDGERGPGRGQKLEVGSQKGGAGCARDWRRRREIVGRCAILCVFGGWRRDFTTKDAKGTKKKPFFRGANNRKGRDAHVETRRRGNRTAKDARDGPGVRHR